MAERYIHRILLRGTLLIGALWLGLSAARSEEAVPMRDTTAGAGMHLRIAPLPQACSFIALGEMVAERDITLFTAELLRTYKVLGNDERNLTHLFVRCGRNWGATAYALALQASSKRPLREVVMYYDLAGWNWQRAAVELGAVSRRSGEPTYTFGVYLNRQQQVWEQVLEAPLRWRRTFLDR